MTRTLPVSEARQSLTSLISKIGRLMDRAVITRNGKPEAVLLSFEEYESWVETLELMSLPSSVAGIRQGLADLRAGRHHSFEKVFGEPGNGRRTKR